MVSGCSIHNLNSWPLHLDDSVVCPGIKRQQPTALHAVLKIATLAMLKKLKCEMILKDNNHPSHSLFTQLLFGKRYRSMDCCTTRLKSNFFFQAVRLLNSSSALHYE